MVRFQAQRAESLQRKLKMDLAQIQTAGSREYNRTNIYAASGCNAKPGRVKKNQGGVVPSTAGVVKREGE